LLDPEEFAFPLGSANHHRNLELPPGRRHRFQQNQVRDIEMADRHTVFLALRQSIPQIMHGNISPQELWIDGLRDGAARR
jgi:hypothetical protein